MRRYGSNYFVASIVKLKKEKVIVGNRTCKSGIKNKEPGIKTSRLLSFDFIIFNDTFFSVLDAKSLGLGRFHTPYF